MSLDNQPATDKSVTVPATPVSDMAPDSPLSSKRVAGSTDGESEEKVGTGVEKDKKESGAELDAVQPSENDVPAKSDDQPEKTSEPKDTQASKTGSEPDDIVSRRISRTIQPVQPSVISTAETQPVVSRSNPPWTLQQFFNGEIDLDIELAKRLPQMPVLSTFKSRTLGSETGRGVATLSTQDGTTTLILDADSTTRVVQLSFTVNSSLTLRFVLNDLTNMDRTRWLGLMGRDQGGLAFLWGPSRWQHDYLICISRQHFTNLYAFSPHNFEAAVRMTPDITGKVLDWLEKFWQEDPPETEPPRLLTW